MTLSFTEFSIDSAALELHIGEHVVAIDERHILLLQQLAEHFPDHCSKQQCLAHIWPDTIVSDMSLSKLVSDTRKIFAKAGYDGPLIQTVHGRGYRLEHLLGKQLAAQAIASSAAEANSTGVELGDNYQTSSSPSTTAPTVTQDNSISNNQQASQASQGTQAETQAIKQVEVSGNNINWWEVVAKTLLALLLLVTLLWQFLPNSFSERLFSGELFSEPSKPLAYSEPNGAIGRILWVDDNPENNLVEKAYFEQKKIGVYNTVTSEEALMLLSMYRYQAVISDMGRHGDSLAGLKLLQAIRAKGHKTPFYLYTYVESAGVVDAIYESGGQAVIIDSESLYRNVLTHFESN
ncbi:winged helix-turn-helix domain-containing protein [Shewanella fidelis]|uniref:winged helix-turn-helix domain-containing protein n=1 Tax=Shewanella fidelis TaxID=173509 RepID=UPI00048FDB12|nr:winged helix-turn-helix domain-containing protein [Shewanella fidelis]